MLHPVKFRIPDGYNAQRLIRDLADRYRIDKARETQGFITFYDTFDWRLFHRSLVLYTSGDKLLLRRLFAHAILRSGKIDSPPGFVRDLPDGDLKNRLAPIVKMRALIKLAEVCFRSTSYRISTRAKKPMARLSFENIRISPDTDVPVLASYLWWKPAKGNPGEPQGLRKRLEGLGFTAIEKEDVYFAAMKASGMEPGDYSTKPDIPLDPGMRSDEATKIILRFLLQVMRINEENLEKDLDTEFLHDYRVALRRTRSALGRMKKVFPLEITARFRKDLSYVGKLTNELRDLDVYLLNEEHYKEMLPASMRADIDPVFSHLGQKRSKVFRDVIRNLRSNKYRYILEGWDTFLKSSLDVSADAPHADIPIRELARKKIYRKYRRIVKEGNLILENSKDEMLHALRIHCKELRYLLEFFSNLFPRKTIHIFIEQLKKLQDMLGAFNDFCVQEQYLTEVAGELRTTGQEAEKTVAAIGVLIEALAGEKQKVKDGFSETFTEYASPANTRAFREVFASRKSASIDNNAGEAS